MKLKKNHMVDLKHMSRADQIELNKFGIDLINQLRTQIGCRSMDL